MNSRPAKRPSLISTALKAGPVNILGIGLSFVFLVFASRTATPTEFGTFSFLLSAMSIASVVASLGYDSSTNRFIGEYVASGNKLMSVLFLRHTSVFMATFGLAVSSLTSLALGLINPSLSITSLSLSFLCIILLSITKVRQVQVRSLGYPIFAEVAGPALMRFSAIGCLSLAWVSLSHISQFTLLSCFTVGLLVSWAALTLATRAHSRAIKPPPEGSFDSSAPKIWLTTSLTIFWGGLAGNMAFELDKVILGVMSTPADVAEYTVASRIAMIVTIPIGFVTALSAPRLSSAYTSSLSKLRLEIRQAYKLILLLALPIIACVLGFPRGFISIFGDGYSNSLAPLIILTIGQAAHALTGPGGTILALTGHHRISSGLMAVTATMNIALTILLIPPLGTTGAAIATAGTTLCWKLLTTYFCVKKLTVNPMMA